MHNAIPPNDIGSRVLHSGQCTREIDGVADNLAKELKLAESHVRISPLGFNHSASDKKPFLQLARAGSHYGQITWSS